MILSSEEYVKEDGRICPHCGDDNIKAWNLEAEGATVYRDVECESCTGEWREVFTLTDCEIKEW